MSCVFVALAWVMFAQAQVDDETKADKEKAVAAAQARLAECEKQLEEATRAVDEARKSLSAAKGESDSPTPRKKAVKYRRKLGEAQEVGPTGPIRIDSAVVGRNVINLPELNLSVTNTSNAPIEAFDIEAECFNSFDEPVKSIRGSNVFLGAASSSVIGPGETRSLSFQLSLHGGTSKALVRVTRAKPQDGEVWSQTAEQAREIPGAIVTAKTPR